MNVLIVPPQRTDERWWKDELRKLRLTWATTSVSTALPAREALKLDTQCEGTGQSENFKAIEEAVASLSEVVALGGTGQSENFKAIEEAVASLSEVVAPEELEYGIDTPLAPALLRLLRIHGEDAVLELGATIESGEMDPALGSWIVRWLGRLSHQGTHRARLWLLERCLYSMVPMIREGAAMGLGSLGDPHAGTALRAAARREHYSRLRRVMEKAAQRVAPVA